MENDRKEPCGLLSRISKLLYKETCSDVVFHVRHDETRRIFYAHSPILIVAGSGFSGLAKQTSQPKVINISEFSPHVVELMLKYLYTDQLNILSMQEAMDLFKLANKFSIDDLVKLCCNYITKEEVNIDNLFVKYESALSCKFPELLEKCRQLARSETKAVFASRYFGEAPFIVVEDIFSQSHLNVTNELDVIHAALRWSECECRRKGRPTEKLCIRDAIDPLLKHLRFLSLSADEFCDLAGKDDNIFTGYETVLLTRKILQPDYKGDFPQYLCSITKPRQPHRISGINNFNDLYSEPVKKNVADRNTESVLKSNIGVRSTEPVHKHNTVGYFSESIADYNSSVHFSGPASKNNFSNYPSDSVGVNSFNDYRPDSVSGNIINRSISVPVNNLKLDEDDFLYFSQNAEKTSPVLAKPEQKPFFQFTQKKGTPMIKVKPHLQAGNRTYDFPLQEMQKGIGFASLKDLKCNAKIRMVTGAILIHGLELKIAEQKHNPDESIEVLSCVTNNFSSKPETCTLNLKNSILSLKYPVPIKVTPGNPTDIEITIEDLHLNRCFVCRDQSFELNCGLSVMAEISVKSNQSNGQDNILYLISRIMYSSTSEMNLP